MMDNTTKAFFERAKFFADCAWRRRWLAMAVAWPTAVVLGLLVALWPDRYEATARVYVDTQTVLKPLMAGLAYQPDIDQQVRMLARTLISRPSVEHLVDRSDLGMGSKDPADREKVVTRLMDKIKVVPAGAGNLYALSYRDVDPHRARRLVEATLDLFIQSGSSGKKRDSEDASRFIDEQIKVYESKLSEAENRLKDFKIRNFGVSGVSDQDYFARISTLSEQVSKLRINLQAAEQSRDALRHELSSESPLLPADPAAAMAAPSELDTRLDAQHKLLDDLLRRYTDQHPDVISARRVIAQLEAQKRQEIEARNRAARQGNGMAATSPIYQKIRISLADTEANIASLRSQLSAQQAALEQVRAMAGRVPKVEADLAQLTRDYDVIRKNYEQLVARRESASLGIKLDETSQLADFRVVEPPRVAPAPVFPSRMQLAVISALLAIAAGIGAALGLEFVHPTFQNFKTLQAISRRPVIGSVSISLAGNALREARSDRLKLIGAGMLMLVLQAAWVAWMAMNRPL